MEQKGVRHAHGGGRLSGHGPAVYYASHALRPACSGTDFNELEWQHDRGEAAIGQLPYPTLGLPCA